MALKLVVEMSGDDLHDRWGTHIAKIADAWVSVMQGRVRFRSTFRMLQRSAASEKARRDTQSWLYYLWGTDAMMAVRRELDDQAGVINIKHLLHEIEARPDVMTRRRFMEWACPSCCWCHYPDEKKSATRHFESFDLNRFPQENEWDEFERDYVDPAQLPAIGGRWKLTPKRRFGTRSCSSRTARPKTISRSMAPPSTGHWIQFGKQSGSTTCC